MEQEYTHQTFSKTELTHTTARAAHIKDKPKQLKLEWRDSNMRVNGANHNLPTIKECLLKDNADVFQGIGTLQGSPYHTRLKQYCQPVQHTPCSVLVSMQKAYRVDLDRLLAEGIKAKVHKKGERVNSTVLVSIPDGTIRRCLDPKT